MNTGVGNAISTIDQLRDPLRQDLLQMQSTMEQARSLIANIQALFEAMTIISRKRLTICAWRLKSLRNSARA